MTLLVTGALLVFLEIFVPGAVAGALGALALSAAIVCTYIEYGLDRGNLLFLAVLLSGGALFSWWMKSFSNSRFGQKWTLKAAVPSEPAPPRLQSLLNAFGRALTPLRPAGTALIAGTRVDVLAQGEMIEAGAPIEVISVEGTKVVVRRGL